MSRGFLISESLRDKIHETITRVAGDPYVSGAGVTNPRLEAVPKQQQQKVFRICTFTGQWSINSTKSVTFKGVTTTPNTVSVTNLVCGLNPSGSCDVSIAKDGTAWYLVQPNLTQQPGYSGSGTQVLTVVNGNLTWIGTTACA